MTAGPALDAAIPGSRKNPEANIAPVQIAYTSISPSFFSSRAPPPSAVDVPLVDATGDLGSGCGSGGERQLEAANASRDRGGPIRVGAARAASARRRGAGPHLAAGCTGS